MTDFVSDGDPFETPAGAAAEGYAATPPSFGTGLAALYHASSTLEPLSRFVQRSEFDTSGSLSGMVGRALAVAGEGDMAGTPGLPAMEPVPSLMLSADDANARYAPTGADGKSVKITDTPIPQGVAQLVGKAKSDEIEREGVLARFENAHSWPVNFAAGTAAFMLDPLNAATAFLPGIGEEAITARLGGGLLARTAGRAVAGASAAAIGQAPLTALRYGLGTEEASDYSLRDAFRDMAFAAAGGAVTQAGFGAIGDVIRARRGVAPPAPGVPAGEQVTQPPAGAPVPPETPAAPGARAAGPVNAAADVLTAPATVTADAMRAAVSQVVDGRPVEVGPIFPAQAAAPATPAPPPERAPIAIRPIRDDQAVLPSGAEVPVRYAIAEAGDLVASQRPNFSPNPEYPAALQPRDRTRSASALQVQDIARNLNPRLLDNAATATDGAPIVGPDGIIESGNGRVMAISEAYREGQPGADAYRQYLQGQGYPVDGIREPVLVRVRQQPMTFEGRAAFAREANQRTTLAMGAAEQARSDAAALSDDVLALHRGGDVGTAGNRDFVRGFIRDVAGPTERAGMLTSDGGLSVTGRRRIEGALVAKAYDDPGIIAAITEDPDSNIKAIGRALTETSPAWAAMRREARGGTINPAVDVTRDLLDAVNIVRQARAAGRNIAEFVKQRDIFAGTISPKAEAFLRIMFKGEDFAQPRSAERVIEALASYVRQARETKAAPGLFGAADVISPREILQNVLRSTEGAGAGPDLFANEAGGVAAPGGRARRGERGGQGPVSRQGGGQAARNVGAAPSDLAAAAQQQRELYAGDFSPGIPAPEMQATASAVYGQHAEARAAAETPTSKADQKLAEAQAMFDASGAAAHPQDAQEIERTAGQVDEAQRARDALGEAGACLGAGGQ